MKKVKITRTMDEVIRSNNGLSLYLDNLSTGRPMTRHSWLYEPKHGEDDFEAAKATLQKWIPKMEAANKKNSPFGEEFNRFDLKQVEKFGPQGGIPPINSDAVWEVVEPLYSPTEYNSESALANWFGKAEEFGKLVFGSKVRRATPLPLESVVKDMARRDTLVTNSGYPNFTRRRLVATQEVQDAKLGKAYDYPAIILFRYYYGKLRPVWMFPMAANLEEASYALVIQSEIQQSPLKWVRDYCTPWRGYQYVKEVLTNQWQGQIDGGDTTKMDAHMRPAQMTLVFHIVKWLFQERYWDDLRHSLLHVCDIDLLWDRNTMIVGTHGLASGSSWTQLSETVLQLFMAYCSGVQGQGIGDDFYWLTDMDADELVATLGEFGLPANAAKQTVSENTLTFLQRMNRKDFYSREHDTVLGAYYPTIRALGSMLLPEKTHRSKDWSSDMFCIRNYTILENCVDDPCFDEFIEFVVRGHRDMVPFAKKTASELNRIQKKARTVPGLFPNYNQEKLDKPLSEYLAINIAKSL